MTTECTHECAICLEPVRAEACTLRCSHVFHSSCLLQSVVHDARCPICRAELAKPPAPAAQQSPPAAINLELTLDDVHQALDEEYHVARRRQTNYDARRRRFLRRRPELLREREALKLCEAELRALDRRIATKWSRDSHALWMGPAFAELKRERTLLLRRIRRRERVVDAAVEAALGERPEVVDDDDDDPESSLFRALARLGRNGMARAAAAPQIVGSGSDDVVLEDNEEDDE